jgi:hypothetical protein
VDQGKGYWESSFHPWIPYSGTESFFPFGVASVVNPLYSVGWSGLCSDQQAFESVESIMFCKQDGISSDFVDSPVEVAYCLPSSLAVNPKTVHAWVPAAEHEQKLAHRKLPKYCRPSRSNSGVSTII